MFTIREASVADIPLIRAITMEVWPPTYVPIIGEQQVAYMLGLFYTPESLEKQMQAAGHKFIIGSTDGQPVAFASYSPVEQGIFKLHKLYVLPGLQGKGIGRQMIAYIADALREGTATALRLNVNIHNDTAINFYYKTGFVKVRDEDIDIGGGYFMNDYVLELPLR